MSRAPLAGCGWPACPGRRCTQPWPVLAVGTCALHRPPVCLMDTPFYRVDEDEEIIVKAMSDYWVVGKKSDQRELYVILNQKNANLIEVNGKWHMSAPGAQG